MIRHNLSLDSILISLESALKIEYTEKDTRLIIKGSRSRIEDAYKVKLSSDIYTLQAENRLVGDTLSIFLAEVLEGLKSLALYNSLVLFDKKMGVTLKDVNYLGFAKEELMSALIVLQDAEYYEHRNKFMDSLLNRVSDLEMRQVKRLLCILGVFESLGIFEGVAIIASYLYMGGL